MKASREIIAKSLTGHYRSEHLLVLRIAWETRAHHLKHIAEIETDIHRRTTEIQHTASTTGDEPAAEKPAVPEVKKRSKSKNQPVHSDSLRENYRRIFGSDLRRITAIAVLTVQALLSEVGSDFSAIPNDAAFSSWAGLCPGTKICQRPPALPFGLPAAGCHAPLGCGGRRLGSRSRRGKPRIAVMLRQSALGLHRSQSALGERYRRLRARLGAPKALTAMAHLLLRIIYKLVGSGVDHDDSIYAKMEIEHRENRINRSKSTAKSLGFTLVPIPAADPQPETLMNLKAAVESHAKAQSRKEEAFAKNSLFTHWVSVCFCGTLCASASLRETSFPTAVSRMN